MRLIKALAVIVPLLVAGLGLVYTVRPSLKPCVGAEQAQFTGVPVFPHVRFHDHLIRTDLPGFVSIDEAMRTIGEENGAGGGPCEFNPGLLNQIFDAVFSGGTVSAPLAQYG